MEDVKRRTQIRCEESPENKERNVSLHSSRGEANDSVAAIVYLAPSSIEVYLEGVFQDFAMSVEVDISICTIEEVLRDTRGLKDSATLSLLLG